MWFAMTIAVLYGQLLMTLIFPNLSSICFIAPKQDLFYWPHCTRSSIDLFVSIGKWYDIIKETSVWHFVCQWCVCFEKKSVRSLLRDPIHLSVIPPQTCLFSTQITKTFGAETPLISLSLRSLYSMARKIIKELIYLLFLLVCTLHYCASRCHWSGIGITMCIPLWSV